MATAVVEIDLGITGLTLTLDIYPFGSDTAAVSSLSMTEATNRTGLYTGTTAAGLTGWHNVKAKASSVYLPTSGYAVLMSNDTSVHRCVDASAAVAAGLLADGTVMLNAAYDSAKGFAAKVVGAVNDASATTDVFMGDGSLSSTDDFYAGSVLAFTSGDLKGLARKIETYEGSTKTITLSAELPAAPANADAFIILGRME